MKAEIKKREVRRDGCIEIWRLGTGTNQNSSSIKWVEIAAKGKFKEKLRVASDDRDEACEYIDM
jgi:hypothetical protein